MKPVALRLPKGVLKTVSIDKKPFLSIKYISNKEDVFDYLITFTIEVKNIKNTNGYISLIDTKTSDIISIIEFNLESNSFSRQFSFTKNNLFDYNSREVIAKLYCDGIIVETKKFQLGSLKKIETCYCNRDFTVDEVKNIVVELRKNTYYDKKTLYTFHSDKIFHRNELTKKEYETEILPETERTFEKLTFVLNKTFNEYKINTCIRKISFLAQMYIETAFYTSTIELSHSKLSYDPFRGRGFIQLTHEGNEDSRTKNATSYLGYKKHSKLDVIKDPSIISKSLHYSADSAGWFWTKGVRKTDGNLINLNDKCGKSESEFKEVTRLIKGSTGEFKERFEAFNALIEIMNYAKCTKK
jgi:predicted chitinase